MEEWILNNWLALYASIVGTFALFVNLTRLIHTVKKDKTNIKLSIENHPQKSKNIDTLKSTEDSEPWNRPSIVEVYSVIIRNIGNVSAYIENVGIICERGNEHTALVHSTSGGGLLVSLPEANLEVIEPKSSRKFHIYLRRNEEEFNAQSAFAIDSTGKKWKAKA